MSEELNPTAFMEKHADTVYEWQYHLVKESAFELYRWGLRTDNMDAINFYGQMLKLFREYDEKFKREASSED